MSRGKAKSQFWILALACLVWVLAGCKNSRPEGALVITQTPISPGAASVAQDILDQRYPAGSRVVLVPPPFKTNAVRILSQGLVAAGSPVVNPAGDRIFFVGKAERGGQWQIYETKPGGGRPKAVTSTDGGAMDPAILGNGDLVFSSPVPKVGGTWKAQPTPALYAQAPGLSPRRLTFGTSSAVEPTVLRDGRILFISSHPAVDAAALPSLGLFTVNNDGTEVTAFALDRDGAPAVRRPRELFDGRVGFLAGVIEASAGEGWPEGVRMARPFLSRALLFSFPANRCRSIEPNGDGTLLASVETRGATGRSMAGSFAVYRVTPVARSLGEPLFDDPAWNDVEAAGLAARPTPMGHISAMNPKKATGSILCLNANFSRRSTHETLTAKAKFVRVLAAADKGQAQALGELPLQADGSFLVDVPANRPIGFETLDGDGNVLSRLPPAIWVRPGENRSCLGCHEPYNRTARNQRPLAAGLPPFALREKPGMAVPKTTAL